VLRLISNENVTALDTAILGNRVFSLDFTMHMKTRNGADGDTFQATLSSNADRHLSVQLKDAGGDTVITSAWLLNGWQQSWLSVDGAVTTSSGTPQPPPTAIGHSASSAAGAAVAAQDSSSSNSAAAAAAAVPDDAVDVQVIDSWLAIRMFVCFPI
jgi:hypothetical protein